MSEKRFVPNNYKTTSGSSIVISDTALTSNKELAILDLTELPNPNSYTYEREVSFEKANYTSLTVLTNRVYSVTLTIKLNKVDSWSSCNLRFIKLNLTNTFGVKQNNTTGRIGFSVYVKLVDLNNKIVQISNGDASGIYTLISRTVTSSTPISAGSWDSTYLIDLSNMTMNPYTNNLLLKALCVKDIIKPDGVSLTKEVNPVQSTLSDNVASSFLNNTYLYGTVQTIDYPEYLGVHHTCTFSIYDKHYSFEDVLLGNMNILTPDDTISVAGTSSTNFTTYNLYIRQQQPISDIYYFRFILTTINGVPKFKNIGIYNCIINYNFQFGYDTDIRTYTFSVKLEPNATVAMPTQFLIDLQENKYLPFKQITIAATDTLVEITKKYNLNEDLLNYVIAGPFTDKPAADYIVEPIGDWDSEGESNSEGDL